MKELHYLLIFFGSLAAACLVLYCVCKFGRKKKRPEIPTWPVYPPQPPPPMYRNHAGKVVFRDEILEKDDHKPKSSGLKDGGMVVLGAGAAVAATVATAAVTSSTTGGGGDGGDGGGGCGGCGGGCGGCGGD